MTDEMLALALADAEKAGAARSVEFLKGTVEAILQPANTIDAVISNCVINLSTDKPAAFVRVLKPSGRIGVSDVVADDALTPAQRAERGDYVGSFRRCAASGADRQAPVSAGWARISPHRATQSEQIHTSGPATRRRSSLRACPQNEQRSGCFFPGRRQRERRPKGARGQTRACLSDASA
jgi:hypothetical protein